MSAIDSIVRDVVAGTRTARSIVEAALERARADTHHCILSLVEERALERADMIDQKRAQAEPLGRLAGVPFLAKDNMLVFGAPTTAASHILENFNAPYQAEAVKRLEAEGAICIGKANLDAFAHGGSTENSFFGPTTNPHDITKVPGGSSGGSAAAVSLGIVPFALGTDTGGSIRQPASYCGVVGMKPTYGAVSRWGVISMASSTDVVGPISTCTADVELVFSCIAGRDAKDATTHPDYFSPHELPTCIRIGVIGDYLVEGVDEEIKQAIHGCVKRLKAQGHTVKTVSLPTLKHALAVYYIVVPAEISSNLARYDSVEYGLRSDMATTLSEVYEKSRSEGFMDENKRRILIGNYVLSSGYYDAYFHKAQSVRTLIINDFNQAFENFDVLIGPVASTPAFGLGQNTHDPLSMYLSDTMTVPASLAGLPALSVPIAKTGAGLPIGLQIITSQKQDALALAVAQQVEKLYG